MVTPSKLYSREGQLEGVEKRNVFDRGKGTCIPRKGWLTKKLNSGRVHAKDNSHPEKDVGGQILHRGWVRKLENWFAN